MDRFRRPIEGAAELHVPALCDVEIASALRRLVRQRRIAVGRMTEFLEDYVDLPLTRHQHPRLLPRMLELRENFTAYDAAYVVLAEQLGAPLLTADARLAAAIGSTRGLAVSLAV